MRKLVLPILVIVGLIALSIIPSYWIARIIAAVMLIGLLVIGHDRQNFSQQQLNDYVVLLEIIALIFIAHIAITHGGVSFGE